MAHPGSRVVSAGDMSNNWRVPRTAAEVAQHQHQQQQQQLLAQQQQMYQYQQVQMALQALNLQTIEMQERLMATMGQTSAQAAPEEPDVDPETARQRRFAAVSSLQRAQQSRNSPEPEAEVALPRANRLSFHGSDGLLEQAVARRTAQSPPSESTFARGHTRNASSTSSSRSAILSEANKRVTSPSTGLTLVLSGPGDAFPSPTLGKGAFPPLSVSTQAARDAGSDSSSSSPRTPSSEGSSEVFSFDSATSMNSDLAPAIKLNPSAPSFMPTPPPAPTRQSSLGSPSARPVRQPRGPCMDDQLPAMNFAGRVRARAFNQMRSKLRASSPVQATFPI